MRIALIALTLGAVCGCGPGASSLTGGVTLDGQPLADGSLLLTPVDMNKGTAAGCEIKGGKYALSGAQAPAPGKYKAEVHANRKSGKQVQKAMGQKGEMMDELVEAVAPRFNKATELTVEVKPGANTADFAVFSK